MDMAILGYGHYVDPAIIGGTQSYIKRLAEHLSDQGHNIDIYVYGASHSNQTHPKPFRRVLYLSNFVQAKRLIKQQAPYHTIIVTNFPLRWFFHQFALSLVSRKCATVTSYLSIVRSSHLSMRFIKNILFRFFYQNIIATSFRLKQEHQRFGSNTDVVLPPVPVSFYKNSARGIKSDRALAIGYVGRISVDKGVDGLIGSFEEIKKKFPHVDVTIYGYHDRTSESARRLHDRLLSSKYIRYESQSLSASEKSDEYVSGLLGEIDILVLPYRELSGETVDIPLLLLEAMASGCVVVSTQVGDIPRVINDDSLVVKEDQDLLQVIEPLINPKMVLEKKRQLFENLKRMGVSLPESGNALIQILERQAQIGQSR
jgi:glycosyltransferase involved in cell wall biosynthesis